ncbi:MAG: polysaccharide export protein [Terrimicrobiaceae bacterium]|nr:polysaccharide export protein [Terrimicrobiaceae bacterium]
MWLKFNALRIAVAALTACAIGGCSAPVVEKKITGLSVASRTSNYRIGPNDLVRMDVFQEPDMQTEQRVAQDGTINIALVGRVGIAGLTVEDASKAIADKLRGGFLVNPQLTISVIEYAPRRFSVLGQVNKPGSFDIPGEEIVTLPTAIAMAEGNTRIGNLRQVLVTRNRGGEIYDIKVNLMTPQGRQFVIEKGDMIMVPESLF